MFMTRLALVGRGWFQLIKSMARPYHPEKHYMRGPGPRWAMKHERSGDRPPD